MLARTPGRLLHTLADVVELHLRKTPRRLTKHMLLLSKRDRRGDNDRASVPQPLALLGEATG